MNSSSLCRSHQRIEQKGRGNVIVEAEPIGYEREYGDAPSPEDILEEI